MGCLRLLLDPPATGAWNMAVDEALLETAADSGRATLRFYAWQEPTLSLGYFQALENRQQHLPSQQCPLVRRASGGGAILHDCELTYSIAIPQASAPQAIARRLYEICHQTLIAALAEYSVTATLHRDCSTFNTKPAPAVAPPFLCFLRRTCFDVITGDVKIAGSAQRRRRGAVLQHGSVLLARSPAAPELLGIHEAAGVSIPAGDLARRWMPLLADSLNMAVVQGSLSADERNLAEALSLRRFAALHRLERR